MFDTWLCAYKYSYYFNTYIIQVWKILNDSLIVSCTGHCLIWTRSLNVPLGKKLLEKFVTRYHNGTGRGHFYYPWGQTRKKSSDTVSWPDLTNHIPVVRNSIWPSDYALPKLQLPLSFDHVERQGDGAGQSTRHGPCHEILVELEFRGSEPLIKWPIDGAERHVSHDRGSETFPKAEETLCSNSSTHSRADLQGKVSLSQTFITS